MTQVFISYSHKDREYAHKLANELKRQGIETWFDDRTDQQGKWPRVNQEGLDTCSTLIVVMSPDSHKSDWVQNEVRYATEKKKTILPILLEGDLWDSFGETEYVDVRDGELPSKLHFETISGAYTWRKGWDIKAFILWILPIALLLFEYKYFGPGNLLIILVTYTALWTYIYFAEKKYISNLPLSTQESPARPHAMAGYIFVPLLLFGMVMILPRLIAEQKAAEQAAIAAMATPTITYTPTVPTPTSTPTETPLPPTASSTPPTAGTQTIEVTSTTTETPTSTPSPTDTPSLTPTATHTLTPTPTVLESTETGS